VLVPEPCTRPLLLAGFEDDELEGFESELCWPGWYIGRGILTRILRWSVQE
jgi:hypothetical protein